MPDTYRHTPAKHTPQKPNPLTPRDRLGALQCNAWLRPAERATIRELLARDADDDDDQLERLHHDMRRRLQHRGPSKSL